MVTPIFSDVLVKVITVAALSLDPGTLITEYVCAGSISYFFNIDPCQNYGSTILDTYIVSIIHVQDTDRRTLFKVAHIYFSISEPCTNHSFGIVMSA